MAHRYETIDWTLDFGPFGEHDVEITYTFSPGAPAQGPSYSSGGQPADPPEIEIGQIFILDVPGPKRDITYFFDYLEDGIPDDLWTAICEQEAESDGEE